MLRHAQLPLMFQNVRNYADLVVKVPVMAESISEGTLKQFSKQIGERVEQDEEIATIETDKVRLLLLTAWLGARPTGPVPVSIGSPLIRGELGKLDG